MPKRTHAALLACFSVLWCGVSASADTLRCQSVNGNLNCAGSSGASCQTVNGKTVCISGHGDVVQSFGHSSPPDMSTDDTGDQDEDLPTPKQRLEQHGPAGRSMLLERDGTRLHVRSDWLSIDRE
jgi:hypothetical protein